MRNAFIYGVIAGAIPSAVIVAGMIFSLPNHTHSVWFGYLVMILALSLIFVGLKRYRDIERGGVLNFGHGFALGLGMAVIAGITYALAWELYLDLSGKDFMAEYSTSVLASMRRSGASLAAIQQKSAELQNLSLEYRNPLFRLAMTFIEIFPVGVVVALLSAAILRRPEVLNSRRTS